MTNETLELAQALVRRKSVTPADEGCQPLIAERLARRGFVAETFACGEVTNLWTRRGTARPLVVLAGHTDVVPPGPREKWRTDPFEPTIVEGKLFGRGTADMKGAVAAFVTACERFVDAHPAHPGSIALLLTSDEEGPAIDGTVRVVEALKNRGETIDYCIVGEPSSTAELGDTIRGGRRGSLNGRLTVHGSQGHVAYPQRARNAVHLAAPALAELAATVWDRGNEAFPPTSFQVSNIHAGLGAHNIIPGQVAVDFNFRFSTESTPASLQAHVEQILSRHGLQFDLGWTLAAKPFLTARGPLVATLGKAIERVTGRRPEVNCAGGTSDGRFIVDICPQLAEFGPVNRSIHKVNESVAVDELEPLSEIYRLCLEELLDAA